ncbi:MAG: DUF1540 domain-containing protein [Firmicutes bacterium]|nr:DUF1540 domain-containing protein [Bacillota bacterium]
MTHNGTQKMNQPLNQVRCIVNTCEYYGQGNHCLASKIEVQPQNAQNSDQTACATFMPKG